MTNGIYKLGRKALQEVAEIITYLHKEAGAQVADKVESRLFCAFSDLATGKVVGHQRPDLTSKRVLFHMASPYMIIFRKDDSMIFIVRVLHASRNIQALL